MSDAFLPTGNTLLWAGGGVWVERAEGMTRCKKYAAQIAVFYLQFIEAAPVA